MPFEFNPADFRLVRPARSRYLSDNNRHPRLHGEVDAGSNPANPAGGRVAYRNRAAFVPTPGSGGLWGSLHLQSTSTPGCFRNPARLQTGNH